VSCPNCGQRGWAIGRWQSPVKRIPWLVVKCVNDACAYEYVSAVDGRRRLGMPVWAVPEREVTR
jgi:hypothetical protein